MKPKRVDPRILAGDITEEEFLRTYWRKKPLFVKNGAKDILGLVVTENAFDHVVRELKVTGAGYIKESKDKVTFVENLSAHMPDLRRLADRYANLFGAPTAWFDGVRTYSDSGIGAHFDHSDNFVLQQTGVKHWTLAPPDTLKKADVARRMLNAPGVGSAPISQNDSISFELQPGDLLYLPLLWVHSGVSIGESLSVSLVCPAVSFQSLLLKGLQQVMLDQLIGHQPVPSLQPFLTTDERDHYSKTLQSVTRTLLNKISSEGIVNMITACQLKYLEDLTSSDSQKPFAGNISNPSPGLPTDDRRDS
jgi:50S ribosomal protein L16 3-hydroxylase